MNLTRVLAVPTSLAPPPPPSAAHAQTEEFIRSN